MNPILISIVPDTSATFVIVATLLALFGVAALLRTNARVVSRQRLAAAYDFPFPTGAVSQITPANRHPVFSRLVRDANALSVQPTGIVSSIGNGLPATYAGPVVVEGTKYLWESRWSHLPSFEQGREGEERVVNTMVNTLGNGWYIFRNFVLPTQDEDIDVVLVGPAGVFAVEVNAYSGEVPSERARCYARTAHGRLYRQRRGAGRQVRSSASKLGAFLKEHGIDEGKRVEPMVVVTGDSRAQIASTRKEVCTVAALRSRLGALSTQTNLTTSQVRTITSMLQAATGEQMRSGLSRIH
jgi:hypothetical protein